MKDAVRAIFYHSQSTDSMPPHIVPVGSGLGASIIVHMPCQSHLHPTHPPSIQILPLICSRSLSGSPRIAWWSDVCWSDSKSKWIIQRDHLATMSEDRVLLCNISGDSCQFGSDLLQRWPSSLCSSPGMARGHGFSTYHAVPFFQEPLPGVCISDEGRSASEEKEAGLHLDRVTLEEQQMEEEGRRLALGDFEGFLLLLPAFFKPTTYQRASLSVYVCAVCVLANNLQLLLVKREDPWLIVYMLVSNLMFTFLAQTLASCHFKKWVKPIYGMLAAPWLKSPLIPEWLTDLRS